MINNNTTQEKKLFTIKNLITILSASSVVALSLSFPASAKSESLNSVNQFFSQTKLLAQGQCYQRMGPYMSQGQAERERRVLMSQGYSTSNVWGEGGVISQWSNRRYFFNVFYRC